MMVGQIDGTQNSLFGLIEKSKIKKLYVLRINR